MITDSFNVLLSGPTDNFIIEGYNHKYLICQRQCTIFYMCSSIENHPKLLEVHWKSQKRKLRKTIKLVVHGLVLLITCKISIYITNLMWLNDLACCSMLFPLVLYYWHFWLDDISKTVESYSIGFHSSKYKL